MSATDRSRLRSFALHRTWRWRKDDTDPDRYLALESTDEGFRYFAWSHLHGEDGLTEEQRQSFEAFEQQGPLWSLPDEIERQVRDWLVEWRKARAN